MARNNESETRGTTADSSRRQRVRALLGVAATAVVIGGAHFWYRDHLPVFAAAEGVANPSQHQSLTLDPAAFSGHAREAYQIASDKPALMAKLHCYCGCDTVLGHRNLLDCFRGTHAASCATCMGEAIDANQMKAQDSPLEQIRDALRARYEHAE